VSFLGGESYLSHLGKYISSLSFGQDQGIIIFFVLFLGGEGLFITSFCTWAACLFSWLYVALVLIAFGRGYVAKIVFNIRWICACRYKCQPFLGQ